MTRVLSFREEEAIRRAGRVDVVCSEADGGRVFHMDAKRLADPEMDFPALIAALIEDGVLLPGFRLPDKFRPIIVMRASARIPSSRRRYGELECRTLQPFLSQPQLRPLPLSTG